MATMVSDYIRVILSFLTFTCSCERAGDILHDPITQRYHRVSWSVYLGM